MCFPPFVFHSQHFRSLCAFSQITRSYNIWDFTKANGQKNDHYYYYFQSCCWGSVIIILHLDCCLFELNAAVHSHKLLQVRPGIKRLKRYTVEFVDGRTENFDALILATGYKSNVPYWLKVYDKFLFLFFFIWIIIKNYRNVMCSFLNKF